VIGTSGPIGAGGNGAQEALKPGESIERGRTICEYIEIMQILPGSSDNAAAYKCITADLQYDMRVIARIQNWKYRNSSRCHMPNSEIANASAVTIAHAAFGRQRVNDAGSGAWRYSR
jgi:hypothetical protein